MNISLQEISSLSNCTVRVYTLPNRKWKETKQQPSMLPGPAVSDCYLVSFYFLWGKLSMRTVCVSVENCLEREIAYSADFFQSHVLSDIQCI